MSREYISIFLDETDKLHLTENDAGRHDLSIGPDVTIFLGDKLDKFMSELNQLYEDHNARKEARRARKENGSKGIGDGPAGREFRKAYNDAEINGPIQQG